LSIDEQLRPDDPGAIDYRHPNYVPVYLERAKRLQRLRTDPTMLPGLRAYYRDHIPQFIADWGMTFDPRNVEVGLPAKVPFILFTRQREWLDWVIGCWRAQEPGITEKSREVGVSWLAVSLAVSLCLFYEGMVIGFGSRKQEYVDKLGEPRSLFFKARMFIENLPHEFRGNWERERDAPLMRIGFPATGSHIGGEAGDDIGRGDRAGIYFVDEAAHLERPKLVDAALSMTTNCRQDISSANSMANSFAERRHSGKIKVFTFFWRDDPRKDEIWYAKKCAELDPVIVAQEIDINYSASAEGIVIPHAWALAAIGAAEKLGFGTTGVKRGALDVGDEGDANAFLVLNGVVVERLDEWHGKGSDIFATVEKSFQICDAENIDKFRYDADGLGAGVRGDARVINERRIAQRQKNISVEPYRGSEGPIFPDGQDIAGRYNKDYFANRKAQEWWSLREAFRLTYRWITEGHACDKDSIVSISPALPLRMQLVNELARPTFTINGAGKILVDKKPDGTKSPNLADTLVIARARAPVMSFNVSDNLLALARARSR
jgi:phage terminase large subunit